MAPVDPDQPGELHRMLPGLGLAAMKRITERHGTVHLGMPDFRPAAARRG
ncbi:hypothetical protein J7F03_39525 [Streptomyces sp. ISL-43]|nr:hypothetical protein [Streptomyces sp. ISL-43]MBT2453016.1 hypothetical protein [Streptomyces sp. ISL-43]